MLLALVLAQLTAGHVHARLISDEQPPAVKPLEEMTREELQREWARIDADEPSFAGPIALTAGGAAMAVVGIVCAIYGATFALIDSATSSATGIPSWVGTTLLVAAVVLLGAGVTMAVFGGFAVRDTVYDRRERNKQLKKIRDLLDGTPPMPFDQPRRPPQQEAPPPASVQNLPPLPVVQFAVASW